MPESHTNRGFEIYASGIPTDYGHIVSVLRSSAAFERYAWLTVKADDTCQITRERGTHVSAHLTEVQALAVYNALGEFLGLSQVPAPDGQKQEGR